MRLDLGYETLDQFDVEILDNDMNVVTRGGGPFIVTLRSPKSDKLKALHRKQADEFSRYIAKLPPRKRTDAQKPEDMATRHGFEVLQAAHVKWANAPVYDEDGKQVKDVDFEAEGFREFLEASDEYSVQILRALGEEKNYQRKTESPQPSKTSSRGQKSSSS